TVGAAEFTRLIDCSRRLFDNQYILAPTSESVDILAIGAHPDDIELGCGGLLIKAAREGHNVYLYTVTKGAVSGDPHERTEESKKAAQFIRSEEHTSELQSPDHLVC